VRASKPLIEHVRDGTFRPRAHGKLLSGVNLPLAPDVRSPACHRIWARLRSLQVEYRDASGVDLRHELALEFSKVANELLEAQARDSRDPLADIAGLREIVKINAHARAQAGVG
jgi:hypothetical protein